MGDDPQVTSLAAGVSAFDHGPLALVPRFPRVPFTSGIDVVGVVTLGADVSTVTQGQTVAPTAPRSSRPPVHSDYSNGAGTPARSSSSPMRDPPS